MEASGFSQAPVEAPARPPVHAVKFNGTPLTIVAELADELLETGVAELTQRNIGGQFLPVLKLAQGVLEASDDPVRENETRARGFGIVPAGSGA